MSEGKPWGGRFSEATDRLIETFTESISIDQRLWRQDIQASTAHAQMLAKVGIMTPAEANSVVSALEAIGAEIASGKFVFNVAREDIHMNIEAALIERLGDVGRKLHSARSRNDQVATDLRLWCRDFIDEFSREVQRLQRAFVELAKRESQTYLPLYTHMQRAQPALAPHVFLAYVEKFARDHDRLADTRRRVNQLPLGSAAVAGTSLPIDRDFVATQLGFEGVMRNSVDATSDRDFVLELAFTLATLATHLSGWAEEWIIWSSTEFDFLALPDRFCTGSSIMPQKRNPDVLELIRGRSAKAIAVLQQVFVLLKGLPLAYNRDLQDDKDALFGACDSVLACVQIATHVVNGAELKREKIAATLDRGFLDATALMEILIGKGLPMREAHEVVGRAVRHAEKEQTTLKDLPLEVFASICPLINAEVRAGLGVKQAVARSQSVGGTGPGQVAAELKRWDAELPES